MSIQALNISGQQFQYVLVCSKNLPMQWMRFEEILLCVLEQEELALEVMEVAAFPASWQHLSILSIRCLTWNPSMHHCPAPLNHEVASTTQTPFHSTSEHQVWMRKLNADMARLFGCVHLAEIELCTLKFSMRPTKKPLRHGWETASHWEIISRTLGAKVTPCWSALQLWFNWPALHQIVSGHGYSCHKQRDEDNLATATTTAEVLKLPPPSSAHHCTLAPVPLALLQWLLHDCQPRDSDNLTCCTHANALNCLT